MSADTAVHGAITGTIEPMGAGVEADGDISAVAESPVPLFEVSVPQGENRKYALASDLRRDIVEGVIPRSAGARVLVAGVAAEAANGGWTTVEELAVAHPALRSAYRPVWDSTLRWMGYGALAGVILKLLDTTVTMFAVDGSVGVVWLVVLGSLLLSSRWALAPVAGLFLSIKAGIGGGLFVAVLAAGLVGVAFGAPAGMVIGTVIGHRRRHRAETAPDAPPEGSRPYALGLALPLLYLSLAVPGYVWLNLKLFDWLAR